MSDLLGSREVYESGGWHDGRVGQAYDLLWAAMKDAGYCRNSKRELLKSVESLDGELKRAADEIGGAL